MKYTAFYIYLHRFSNGVMYVGKGRNGRFNQFSKGRHNIYWDRLKEKHGKPRARILIGGMSEEDAYQMETEVIARLKGKGKRLCNLTEGGNGCRGMKVSQETRGKLSFLNSGERNNMFGKKHRQESISKMKKAISKIDRSGSSSPRYNNDCFEFIHEDGRVITGTAYDLCRMTGVSRSHASLLCSGKSKSAKGWRLSSTSLYETGKKGKRHGRYDHTIFCFEHDSGIIERCTKHELFTKYRLPHASNLTSLCKGKISSYKGWRLLQVEVDNN